MIYSHDLTALLDTILGNLFYLFVFLDYSQEVSLDEDSDQQLAREKMIALARCPPVVTYLKHCDHILYQCIVDFLIPEVLHPIPGTLTQAIRNFAKSLETSLSGSLHGYPHEFVKAKVCICVCVCVCVCGCAKEGKTTTSVFSAHKNY